MTGTADVMNARPVRRHFGRDLLALGVAVVVLLSALFGSAAWYFAGEIGEGTLAVNFTDPYDVAVDSYTGGRVTLHRVSGERPNDPLESSGIWGLIWPGGTGVLDGVPQVVGDGSVRRALRVTSGPPPGPGTPAFVQRNVWRDPADAYGLAFEEVVYPCPGGGCPAWYVPGDSSTWVVMVHGINEARSESLRALGPVVAAHLPALIISYREDPGAPPDRSNLHQQGATEWRDLEQAVDYALAHGARRVVLFGASMGGGTIASFMEHSPSAAKVSGVVLDAPMLDLRETVDYGAAQRRVPVLGVPLPRLLVLSAEWIASVRYDLDWRQVDYLDQDWLHVPALVFHGSADRKAPMSTSERLRTAHPGLVDLVRVPGADHVESWNVDPTGYQLREAAFLACVGADAPATSCLVDGA